VSEAQEAGQQEFLPVVAPDETERRALLEAIVYVAEEPLTVEQIAEGLELPREMVEADLEALMADHRTAGRGIEIRKVAKGDKMFTKAEHHEAVRRFVKTLRPKLRLSLPALETLSVIAYKQPVTVPEIQAVRGVNVSGTIHTLLSHKLITTAGRKAVIGRPMLYKTTKEFLVQFGLNDVSELPDLKELEELSRAALGESEEETDEPRAESEAGEGRETSEWERTAGGEESEAEPGEPEGAASEELSADSAGEPDPESPQAGSSESTAEAGEDGSSGSEPVARAAVAGGSPVEANGNLNRPSGEETSSDGDR